MEYGVPVSAGIIFIAAIFTNNILLSNLLGMCSFLAISKELKSSVGLGVAVIFVLTFTCAINYPIYVYLLEPNGLGHLQLVSFIVVIAASVQVVEMVVERTSPTLYAALGIFLPLITVNCAILGGALLMITRKYSYFQSVMYAFGAGIGWLLAIVAMAGIRHKLRWSHVPKSLQGPGITMILAGLMAMGFMGFAGMVSMQ